MKVVVKAYLFLRETLGNEDIALELPENTTVRELLQILERDYGMPRKLYHRGGHLTLLEEDKLIGLNVLINGRNIKQLDGINTLLDNGSIVSLFPPAAGG